MTVTDPNEDWVFEIYGVAPGRTPDSGTFGTAQGFLFDPNAGGMYGGADYRQLEVFVDPRSSFRLWARIGAGYTRKGPKGPEGGGA